MHLDPVHTSMLARLGSARHNEICNVNTCPTEPYRTKLDQAGPLDTTGPARYGWYLSS